MINTIIDHSLKNKINKAMLGSLNVKFVKAYIIVKILSSILFPSEISILAFKTDEELFNILKIPGKIPRQICLPIESSMQFDEYLKGLSNFSLP